LREGAVRPSNARCDENEKKKKKETDATDNLHAPQKKIEKNK
jgi:hypothetical protein